jgi:hypothetical protein
MGWHVEGSKYYGWTSNREEDQNAYRLGMRDGIFGYWMTRPGQINETKSTRKNYICGFIDGIKFSEEKAAAKSSKGAGHASNEPTTKCN